MSIIEDINKLDKLPPRNFTEWFNRLDGDDQAALEQAATNPFVPTTTLVRLIRKNGGVAGTETIAAWRSSLGRNS